MIQGGSRPATLVATVGAEIVRLEDRGWVKGMAHWLVDSRKLVPSQIALALAVEAAGDRIRRVREIRDLQRFGCPLPSIMAPLPVRLQARWRHGPALVALDSLLGLWSLENDWIFA